MDRPTGSSSCELVYKTVGSEKLYISFKEPLEKIYESAPVYLVIPGGGWRSADRFSMLGMAAVSVEALRRKGFAAASIGYRIANSKDVFIDDIISDCFDALRYLAHYKDILKIDTERIAVSGHSAGGHLALMLAYAPEAEFRKGSVLNESFKIRAVAPMSPPTILHTNGYDSTLAFSSDYLFKDPDMLDARIKASPISWISPDSPATLLCAGTGDTLVFHNSSEYVYKKLCENDVTAELVLSEGGGHCFEEVENGKTPSLSLLDIQNIITEFVLNNC